MKGALKPGGIICSQGGTFWTDMMQVKETLKHCRTQFPVIGYGVATVPSYPCGQIGFVIGSLDENMILKEPKTSFTNDELVNLNLRYYTTDVHKAAFSLPLFAEKELFK